MTKKDKIKKYKQKVLNQRFTYIIFANLLIVSAILFIAITESIGVSGNNKSEDESNITAYELKENNHNAVTSSANAPDTIIITVESPKIIVDFSRNLSEEDKYLLAKIAMAEAEGESIETKVFIILTVLNRVNSEDKYFPDTVKEVIFQNNKGIYQFSPVMTGGRWWSTEPNEDCWKAVEIVNAMENDSSMGALYFESCQGESWHSKNLKFLFESDDVRFYK